MAHRMIIQLVITGAQVFGRAARAAYQQASAKQTVGAAAAGADSSNALGANKMTLEEAAKILHVPVPKQGQATDMEHVIHRFKRMFDQNEPTKGGSFYLQSKVLRARERIELEVRQAEEILEREAELKKGWAPKLYKE